MATEKPMRRITVDEVLEAYRMTGLKPVRFTYCDPKRACAMGVLLVAEGKASPVWWENDRDRAIEQLGLDRGYCMWFERGFDGVPLDYQEGDIPPFNEHGYTDGQACAAAVFGEGDGDA